MKTLNVDFYRIFGNAPFNFLYHPLTDIKIYGSDSIQLTPNTPYYYIINSIADKSTVLDVGCGSGHLGEYLKHKKNCNVYGLDISEEALKKAKERNVYSKLFKIDLENIEESKFFFENYQQKFDYIVLADVLEHLNNINHALINIWSLLKKEGSLLVSVPNINHIDIVFNLIKGNFNYSLFGILDNTHLRFFTEKSFKEWVLSLLGENNMKVELIGRTIFAEIFGVDENSKDLSTLKSLKKLYERHNTKEEMYTVQNIFKITKV